MKDKCAICFKAVSTRARLRIFNALKEGNKKYDISDLVEMTGLRQPTVTFHINQLAKAGLVSKVKTGRNVYCQVASISCPHCPLLV